MKIYCEKRRKYLYKKEKMYTINPVRKIKRDCYYVEREEE